MAFDRNKILELIKKGKVTSGGKKVDRTIFDNLVKTKKSDKQKATEKQIAEAKKKAFILLCEQKGLPTPTPEYYFRKTRKWRNDYYLERDGLKVALEVEGGVHTNGRHTRGKGFVGDMEKYNAMAIQGIYLLRVQPKELGTEGIRLLLEFFK